MDHQFKKSVEHARYQDMFQARIYLRRRPSQFFQYLLIGMGCFRFDLHHFINQARKILFPQSSRESACILPDVHRHNGASRTCIAPEISLKTSGCCSCGRSGKIFLRLFETIQQILVMLTGQRLEQLFLALVIAIKCPCCHTHGFYDVPQGSVFVAFFQELCLGSLVDAF